MEPDHVDVKQGKKQYNPGVVSLQTVTGQGEVELRVRNIPPLRQAASKPWLRYDQGENKASFVQRLSL